MELITIKTFDNVIEAYILKSRLENEGINCFVFDENIVTINPLYAITVGGIKLKVAKSDEVLANQIVKEVEMTPSTDNQNQTISCPKCNSSNVYLNHRSVKNSFSLISIVVSFLFAIFPFYFKTLYRCKECENEFKLK